MNLKRIAKIASTIALLIPIGGAYAASSDALIVLTTVGYLTGAADACKVASKESNQLSSGMALAIGKKGYGDPAQAHTLFNNARQKGIEEAGAKKVDCAKVGESVRQYARSLQTK